MPSDFDSVPRGGRPEGAARGRRHGRRLWAALMLGTAMVVPACTAGQLAGQSPAYLIVDQLEAASGTGEDFEGSLTSDVQTKGSVFEDVGRVAFRLALKDPGATDSPTTPSTTNFITVRRYHVRFVRSERDRNTQGVHVPYEFDGAMTVTVDGTGAAGTFVLVRAQAKLEAPLIALRHQGGAVAISTIAEVTFYGEDQAGREVSVVGQISVNFADWADPE
ncbi:MAG: hypothetical protein IT184_02010 [Acidobacteria bacterium]|nr:hypothetical protein [Acidobacteriota bacterium]